MKKEYFLYIVLGAAAVYIYKLKKANTFLAKNCGFTDNSITFSETITQKK
tara:strand:- start:813 stop:962 length:150 start_codon:yes stop_codon:yes gene_type:complete